MKWKGLYGIALSLCIGSSLLGQTFDPEAQRAREIAAAGAVTLTGPAFPLAGYDIRLVVLNMTSRTVDFSIQEYRTEGSPQKPSQYSIDLQRHLEIPLALHPNTEFFELTYTDIPAALDVRLVASGTGESRVGQVASYPFQLAGSSEEGASRLFAWPALENAPAIFRLVNVSDQTVPYTIRTAQGDEQFVLAPKQSATYRGQGGFLSVSHEADPGALLTWGLQDIAGRVLEVSSRVKAETIDGITDTTTVHVPTFEGALSQLFVTLANPTSEPHIVPLQVYDNDTSGILSAETFELAPNSARTIKLVELWPFLEEHWNHSRIAVGPTAGGVFPVGFAASKDHQLVELSFQEIETAHGSGMYPVPSLEEADVVLHLLNTSTVDAAVGVELAWMPKTDSSIAVNNYSMGPFDVLAGQGIDLDLREELAKQVPDMLERLPPEQFEQGFLKWIATRGDKNLLGRTEILDLQSQDRFGINCETCCWETPTGVVINGTVVLTKANVSKKFETGIEFDTCSGASGPFYEPAGSLNYSAPFSWDGRNVSASDGAEADLTWDGTTIGIDENCRLYNVGLFGKGKAKACDLLLGKWKKDEACNVQTGSCSKCKKCCDAQFERKICLKKRQDIAEGEQRTCKTNCEIENC